MILLVSPVLAGILLGGCTPTAPAPAPAPAPQPATPQQAAQVQADIVRVIPGAQVGHVSGISGTQAAVAGISLDAVKIGESIQFTDGNSVGIANGTVFYKDATSPDFPFLIVDFEPLPNGRAPIKGDLAIYSPPKH
jgi:hypothetical protein